MARSRITENQVVDTQFLSEEEHTQLDHYFVSLADTPTTFSGAGNKHIRIKDNESELEFVSPPGEINDSGTGDTDLWSAEKITDYVVTVSGSLNSEIDFDISIHTSNADAHHDESHTIVSHSDTSATGANLNTLTDNSIADALHRHSELVASDGNPDPALSVDVDGNVGIGTSSPQRPLHMVGSGTSESGWARFGLSTTEYTEIGHRGNNSAINAVGDGNLDFRHDGETKVTVQPDGKVGIGTTSPQRPLHMIGDGTSESGWARFGLSTTEYTEIGHRGFNSAINAVGDGNLDFRHDGETKVTVQPDGKVGVGTSSPGSKLEVAGDVYISSDLRVEDGAVINGNFTVSGTTFTTHHETVEITDNILLINNGEVGPGVTVSGGLAGIEVDRGSSTNYRFIFDEISDSFKIGEIDDLQSVATRENVPIDTNIPYWNSAQYRFDTNGSISYSNVVDKSLLTTTSGNLQTQIDTIDSDISTHKSDTTSVHGITDTSDLALKSGNVNQFSDITSTGANIEDAVTKKHTQLCEVADFTKLDGIEALADVSPALPSDEYLVGYWAFDDGSGDVAVDGSGNENNGTLVNMEEADWVDGVVGKCLSFDGVNEKVTVEDDSSLDITNNLTGSAWIYLNSHVSGWYSGIDKGCWQMRIRGDNDPTPGRLNWVVYHDDATYTEVISDSYLSTGVWYHIVFVYEKDVALTLYKNGDFLKSSTVNITKTIRTNNNQINIGFITSYFHGPIDEVRIYNTALTASEIKALYLYPAGNKSAKTNTRQLTGDLIELKNETAEDGDYGRESEIIFAGAQSGGEVTTLGKIQFAHDGTSDDQKGIMTVKVNDGNDGDSPTDVITIDAAGNVGIGTTAPVNKLAVTSSDDGNTIAMFINTDVNNGYGVQIRAGDNDDVYSLRVADKDNTELFQVHSAGKTYIKGNVGIGTTSPGGKLCINGGLTVGSDTDAGDNNLRVEGDIDLICGSLKMADNVIERAELKDYSETKTDISSSSGVLTMNLANGNVFATTLTENVTTFTISNPSPTGKACSFTLILTQAATAKSVTWATSIRWEDGIAPTIDTNSAVYIFTFLTVDAGTKWYGFVAGSKMAVPA